MNLYAFYKEYRDNKWTLGEIPVLKETDKRVYVERVHAGGFAGVLDKERNGEFTLATTPGKAWDIRYQALSQRVARLREDLKKAEEEVIAFIEQTKEYAISD